MPVDPQQLSGAVARDEVQHHVETAQEHDDKEADGPPEAAPWLPEH